MLDGVDDLVLLVSDAAVTGASPFDARSNAATVRLSGCCDHHAVESWVGLQGTVDQSVSAVPTVLDSM